MHQPAPVIGSETLGNPDHFRTREELERELGRLPPAPKDKGTVTLLMSRGEGGRRHILKRARLEPGGGMPGDAWERGSRKPDAALAVMQTDIAQLLCHGQPLELSGDNLYLALDLSAENLPPGSRVRLGKALLEVTPMAHEGCKKFRARFGADALRFISDPKLRHRNYRGIYMRVLAAGEVAAGDVVQIVSRARPARG